MPRIKSFFSVLMFFSMLLLLAGMARTEGDNYSTDPALFDGNAPTTCGAAK